MAALPHTFFRKPVPRLAFALGFAAIVLLVVNQADAVSWETNGLLHSAHYAHTATLLANGKVLIVGGFANGIITNAAEIYDPASGANILTGFLSGPRALHTATLLRNGKVLLAGGAVPVGGGPTFTATNSAELYDPLSGTWSPTGSLNTARLLATATLLPDGKVLVIGGLGTPVASLNTAELYDPVPGTWSLVANPMKAGRYYHTATLLPNNKVLVVGGGSTSGLTNSAELFDPDSGTWSDAGAMSTVRFHHTATLLPNGKVLVAGGKNNSVALASAEVYDPNTGLNGTWTTASAPMYISRYDHSASLLPNGKVLIAGGADNSGNPLNEAELYDLNFDIITQTPWSVTASLNVARVGHTATLLPAGRVFVAGGGVSASVNLSSTEVYDFANGAWLANNPLATPRNLHTATLLPSGKVLVAGGAGTNSSAELYDTITKSWTNTSPMNFARSLHTATLLVDGTVLIAGGLAFGFIYTNGVGPPEQLYDPATDTWANTDTLKPAREKHTTTLLPNGKVLVAGGELISSSSATNGCELYDPALAEWTLTDAMAASRYYHTTTLLPNGKVLVAGGNTGFSITNRVELYDPFSGTWSNAASLNIPRAAHTATLLPNGKVLVAGGAGADFYPTNTAELYDPAADTWMNTGALNTARNFSTATLLPNGKVLVAGGYDASASAITSAELYDPAAGRWTPTSSLSMARASHSMTLLPTGTVLGAGGYNGTNALSSTELYDVGLSFSNSWQPQITGLASTLESGQSLALGGSKFRGISEASGGNSQDSSSDHPIVQLRSLESERSVFLLTTNWSTTSFISFPVTGFPPGLALATVFVNGIPGASSILLIKPMGPTEIVLTDAIRLAGGAFRFGFSNTSGINFTALATTNLSQPSSNWASLGGVAELSPGQFQFTDAQAANSPLRFYRVRLATTYTVIATAGPGGSISPGGSIVRPPGATLSFTATPDIDFAPDVWTLDGLLALSNAPSFTITNLQADHALGVTFRQLSCLQGDRFDTNALMNLPDLTTNTSRLTVAGLTGHITGVTVLFYITHTFDGDLKIDLIGPDNTTINLVNRRGSAGHNFGADCAALPTVLCDEAAVPISSGVAPFEDIYLPEQALSAFSGKTGSAVNGQWGLRIADSAAADSGQLHCWSLVIRTAP